MFFRSTATMWELISAYEIPPKMNSINEKTASASIKTFHCKLILVLEMQSLESATFFDLS